MKKTFFICVLSAIVSSIGASTSAQEDKSEPVLNVASNTTNSIESNDTISLEKYPFTSYNRQLYDLRGDVSKMVLKRLKSNSVWRDTLEGDFGTEYLFDKNGKLIDNLDPSGNGWKSVHSGNGQIQKRDLQSGGEYIFSEKYLYNKDGMLKKMIVESPSGDNNDTTIYQYDKYLNLITSNSSGIFEEFQSLTNTRSYRIIERDSKGNWTKRYLTSIQENRYTPSSIDDEGEDEEVVEKSTTYLIELRNIEYYADSQPVSSISSDSKTIDNPTSNDDSQDNNQSSILVWLVFYIFYFIFLAIVFLIVKLVITKIFRKEISKKKMRKYFLILLAIPFVLFKSCDSCSENSKDVSKSNSEKVQESYVRDFLIQNEAAALVLPKFKVNSYEDAANEYDKWIIEFEEPIDDNQLMMIDTNGTATLEGGVLYFPIEEKDDYNSEYDYRNFKLEILPDGKTAILLYSYHKLHNEISSSGGSSHHWHHDD